LFRCRKALLAFVKTPGLTTVYIPTDFFEPVRVIYSEPVAVPAIQVFHDFTNVLLAVIILENF
jgi:hypothetical protein